ncbi:MAG: hypothetical protein SGBAC_004539 [Bacillariaceae sp.]
MEHALLRTIKAFASLLMIATMISIVVLETLLPGNSEQHEFHGNRILERDFTASADHSLEVMAVSSKNRKHSDGVASKFSPIDHGSVEHAEVGEGQSLIIPLEKSTPSVPTIKSSKSSVFKVSSSSLTKRSESESSSGDEDGTTPYEVIDHRYHITRYRRSDPELAQVTHYESIFDAGIKSFQQTRQFPYILCQGEGLIVKETKAPTVPTPKPTRAPVVQVIEPTNAPIATLAPVPVPVADIIPPVSLKSSKFGNLNRMVSYGSITDVHLYGKPKRIVRQPAAFGDRGYLLPVVDPNAPTKAPLIHDTRAPTIEPTKAPTPFPTPREYHKVCKDGRIIEIDGTHGPTVLPTIEPTRSPESLETRPPAFIGYVWGNGYGNENDDSPRWSFTKNEGKILFDHPNLEKAVYRGNFAQVRRQFKRRVDTLSPW